MVRLKYAFLSFAYAAKLFQFHYGSIKIDLFILIEP